MTAYVHTIGESGVLAANAVGHGLHQIRIDLAKEAANQGISSFGAGDVLTILVPPAGTFVSGVFLNVLKAEGAVLTVDIGDADNTAGYHDNANLNVLGRSRGVNALTEGIPNVFTGYTNGKFYATNGALKITFNDAGANLAIFDVFVPFIPMDSPPVRPFA